MAFFLVNTEKENPDNAPYFKERERGQLMENILNNITLSYQRQIRRRTMALTTIFGLTLILAIYAVTQGAYGLSPMQAIWALLGNAGEGAAVVIWNIRLPRIIASLVVGWGLSLSGLGIQSLLRNPLGSPSTLGISQGAAFGAAAAIVFLGAGIISVTLFAFVGAMAATIIILILARLKRLSPEAIILSGVALSACSDRPPFSFSIWPRTSSLRPSFSGHSGM